MIQCRGFHACLSLRTLRWEFTVGKSNTQNKETQSWGWGGWQGEKGPGLEPPCPVSPQSLPLMEMALKQLELCQA